MQGRLKRAAGWFVGATLGATLLFSGVAVEAAKTKIQWMNWNSGGRLDAYKKWVSEFEKQNPDIEVEMVQVGWAELREKATTAVAGGVAPDVVSISSGWDKEFAAAGVLLDLRTLIQKDKSYDFDAIFPAAYRLWQGAGGEQYGFPHDLDIEALVYNEDLFDQFGLVTPNDKWTWNDMLTSAIKLSVDKNGDGKKDFFGISNWFFNWYSLIWANGGNILNADNIAPALNSKEARAAIEFWGKFYPNRLYLMPQSNVDWSVSSKVYPSTLFAQGKVGMQPAGAWVGASLIEGKVAFTFNSANMPLSPNKKRATMAGGQSLGIIQGTKNLDAAWRFVKYMSSPPVQDWMSRYWGQMPVRRAVALSDAFLTPNLPPKNKKAYVEAAEYGRGTPKTVKWGQVAKEFSAAMGQYFGGTLSLDVAIENFGQKAGAILKQK